MIVRALLFIILMFTMSYVSADENHRGPGDSGKTTEETQEFNSAIGAGHGRTEKKTDSKDKRETIFLSWFSNPAYAKAPGEDEEKTRLRNEWKETFGLDVFMPYFKQQEAEEWIKAKAKVKIFKIKGRPDFSSDGVRYIFKVKF